jgi:hypothetical protein
MSLVHFHRFLIVAFIIFSGFFAWRSFDRHVQSGGTAGDLWAGVVALVVGLGFILYLRTVRAPAGRDPPR